MKEITDSSYRQKIIQYYSEAGMDYEPWSRKFNMHFGYYRWGINPFSREALLAEMNAQVLQRLDLTGEPHTLIDLGCGVGATARFGIEHCPHRHIHGITIVPWQVAQAEAMTPPALLTNRINFSVADYCDSGLESNSFEGAYAIESSCYAGGTDKKDFLTEAFRLLAPGSKLVVADGFIKTNSGSRLFNFAYKKVCEGWSLDTFANIHHFKKAMEDLGFEDISIEECSMRIAPSVLFVPWVSIKYFFSTILSKDGNKKLQKLHFIAPMMGIIVGLHRKRYGYYLVSGRKPCAQ